MVPMTHDVVECCDHNIPPRIQLTEIEMAYFSCQFILVILVNFGNFGNFGNFEPMN